MITDDWNDELEADLRRDAKTWDATPSADTTDRLRAAIAETPSRSPIVLGPGLVAAAVLALIGWGLLGSTSEKGPQDGIGPLQLELDALSDDVNTLALAVWQNVPGLIRRLIEE